METTSSNRALFKRLSIRLILTIVLILLFIYGLPIIFQLLYPFIFALVLAGAANPLVNGIERWFEKLKIKTSGIRSIVTFFMTILILLSLLFLLYLIVSTLLNEIFQMATSIQNNWTDIVRIFENTEHWLTAQMDIMPIEVIEILEGITENVLDFIRNFSRNLLNYTVAFTGLFISKAGSVSLNLLTFFLSLYFILSDFDNMKNFLRKHTDKRILSTVSLLKNTTVVGVWGYVKTQLILSIFAFVVMFLSFTLYGIEYALTIAIFLAIIDLIPLIGTIAVLLPWGIFEFIWGVHNFGIFLIVLGIVFFLMRRLLEPKIMGTQTGLHPLFALIGIYVGIQFSGLWGALLGPLIMVVLIGFLRSGILDNTFADINELYQKIVLTLKRGNV